MVNALKVENGFITLKSVMRKLTFWMNQHQNDYQSVVFFYSVLRPFQDYFSSYETGQSVSGVKMGEPQEKPPGTPASRTWLVSHVARAGLKPTPDTASGEMIEWLRNSAFNRSANGGRPKIFLYIWQGHCKGSRGEVSHLKTRFNSDKVLFGKLLVRPKPYL